MTDWAMISALCAAFALASSFGTWLFTRGGKAAVSQERAKMLQEQVTKGETREAKLDASYDELLERLHKHEMADVGAFTRLEALATQAASAATGAEVRLTKSMENLAVRFDALADNLNRFMRQTSQPQ